MEKEVSIGRLLGLLVVLLSENNREEDVKFIESNLVLISLECASDEVMERADSLFKEFVIEVNILYVVQEWEEKRDKVFEEVKNELTADFFDFKTEINARIESYQTLEMNNESEEYLRNTLKKYKELYSTFSYEMEDDLVENCNKMVQHFEEVSNNELVDLSDTVSDWNVKLQEFTAKLREDIAKLPKGTEDNADEYEDDFVWLNLIREFSYELDDLICP